MTEADEIHNTIDEIIHLLKDDIVYTYSWEDIIRITRTKSGKWSYHYTISDLVDYLNKKRQREDHLSVDNPLHLFEAGVLLGYKVNDLLKECIKSYDDHEKILKESRN